MSVIRRISCWIVRRYTTTWMIIFFLISFIFLWLFNVSLFPISNQELIKLSGHQGMLDRMFFYSAQDAFTALKNYGALGRKLYLAILFTDFFFIIVYNLAFSFLITAILLIICGNGSAWLKLNVIPFGMGFFDCIENICIVVMLKIYPLNSKIIGTISGLATLCKWVFALVLLSCLIYSGILIFLHCFGFWKYTIKR